MTIERNRRGYTLDMGGWNVDLQPRLGLHQLSGHSFDGRALYAGRPVWEYAVGLIAPTGRKAWAGNGHKWEVQTGVTLRRGAVERRSLLLNPLRAGRPLARSRVMYRPTPDGLEVSREMTWLTDATLGLHYVAMLPLGPSFTTSADATRTEAAAISASDGDISATLRVEGGALMSSPVNPSGTKLYAARSTNEAPERVERGDRHHVNVLYTVRRS